MTISCGATFCDVVVFVNSMAVGGTKTSFCPLVLSCGLEKGNVTVSCCDVGDCSDSGAGGVAPAGGVGASADCSRLGLVLGNKCAKEFLISSYCEVVTKASLPMMTVMFVAEDVRASKWESN